MPRFFLHIRSGLEFVEDEEGMVLVDLAAAMGEALKGARGLMSAEVLQGSLCLDQAIEIHVGEAQWGENEAGDAARGTCWHLATLTFAEALRIVHADDSCLVAGRKAP